jgi:hypothetical protein
MNLWRFRHAFMDEASGAAAGDGGASAGGAAAGGAPGDGAGAAAGAGGAGGDAGAAASGAAGGNALAAGAAAGAAGAAGAGAGAQTPFGWIPEKFHVKKEDGSLDPEASARKVEEHRANLEQRLGSGDIRPKTADEYKINVPEQFKESLKPEDLAKDEKLTAFLKDAHAAGLSQKQVDFALGEFFSRLPEIAGGIQRLDTDQCVAELRKGWKTDEEYRANNAAAYRAAQAYGGSDFDAILKDYGNDPRIVRMLANVGKEMGEAPHLPGGTGGTSEADVEALQKSPAYWNPSHPEHTKTKQKVDAFYAEKFGTAPRQSGVTAFQSR